MTASRFGFAAALALLPLLGSAFWPPSLPGPPTTWGSGSGQSASADFITGILAAGDRSPAGVDASNMMAAEALKRAEQAIFGLGGTPDRAERRFWLSKSITLMLAEPQSRWALTQLGTLYTQPASPKDKQDYASAKTLWELASASGDPVAACFLAELYELGLGVAKDSQRAAQWARRADRHGGCQLERDHRRTPRARPDPAQ